MTHCLSGFETSEPPAFFEGLAPRRPPRPPGALDELDSFDSDLSVRVFLETVFSALLEEPLEAWDFAVLFAVDVVVLGVGLLVVSDAVWVVWMLAISSGTFVWNGW